MAVCDASKNGFADDREEWDPPGSHIYLLGACLQRRKSDDRRTNAQAREALAALVANLLVQPPTTDDTK